MKMIFAVMMGVALSANAFAAGTNDVPPNVPKNIRYQAAVGACQPKFADWGKFDTRANGLSLYNNTPGTLVTAKCAPLVDVSDNGTDEVGLYISNNDGGTVPVTATCVMTYNTASVGPRTATQSVTVPAGTIRKLSWSTEGIIFGGPITFVCALPYKAGVMRVFSISQHSS